MLGSEKGRQWMQVAIPAALFVSLILALFAWNAPHPPLARESGSSTGDAGRSEQTGKNPPEPWTASDVLQPAELAQLLSNPKSKKPLILCVGFDFLYRQAHIPGAEYHGPGGKPQGLDNLKQRVERLPHSQSIVLYCGCCPWTHCPNIRPAFSTLHEMGFSHVKVLSLPTDFSTDWAKKGFPIENPPHP
jgi:thiosulfate/3-mercaptopyruvate sulfurtransferase